MGPLALCAIVSGLVAGKGLPGGRGPPWEAVLSDSSLIG